MPPLDWSIVQSMLLFLIFPSVGIAAGILAIAFAVTQLESRRSIAAALAFVAGLAAGLAVQNFRGELVPFLAIQRASPEQAVDQVRPGESPTWELETGWRSLFSVTLLATLAEIAIEILFRQHERTRSALVASGLIAVVCAIWLTPWNLSSSRPWVCCLLSMVIILNGTTLRLIGQFKEGPWVSLTIAVVWGGSATAVLVLSHSARFADLAVLLSCALAGVGLVTALTGHRPKSLFAGPATFVPGLMLAGLLNTYSDIPNASFTLVALAPGSLVFLHWTRLRSWFEPRPIALAFALLVPCGIATILAIQAEF